MRMWEETSYHLDLLQTDADCVHEEFSDVTIRTGPDYHVTFDPDAPVQSIDTRNEFLFEFPPYLSMPKGIRFLFNCLLHLL